MHKATVVRDAAGVPTGLSNVATESLVGGAIGSLTGIANQDTILIPEGILDSVVLVGVPAAVGAFIQKKQTTGEFGIPFKA